MQLLDNISDRQNIAFGNTENDRLWRFQNTDNQYRYSQKITPNSTGKELDAETGYSYFGARYLDHALTTVWLSVDPMSDKYPSISPYAYCAWNPVKLVDPEGEKVVFVNGYLGFGSPNGGKKYWGDSFISGAKSFFHDNTTPYFTNVEHGIFSTAAHRQKKGYDYAKENYASLIEGMEESESFKFVSHSMGGAFAMGMKEYLEERGWSVESMVFINTYQCDKIKMKKNDPTYMIDYQNTNDPVLFWFDINLGMGELKGADIIIRAKSDKELSYRHAGPISSGSVFWKELKKQIDSLFAFE